jgi:hypothetical protein
MSYRLDTDARHRRVTITEPKRRHAAHYGVDRADLRRNCERVDARCARGRPAGERQGDVWFLITARSRIGSVTTWGG